MLENNMWTYIDITVEPKDRTGGSEEMNWTDLTQVRSHQRGSVTKTTRNETTKSDRPDQCDQGTACAMLLFS